MPERVALVTGGSRGIGRATCLALAKSNLVVVNHSSSLEEAKEVVGEIEAAGGEAMSVQADVSDPGQVAAMFEQIEDAFGEVSILVNNAGIRRDGLALRMKDADWTDVIGVNLSGAFFCARRALRPMIRRRWGRIVNVASVAGLRGSAGQANYCASKAGLIGLTQALAREVAGKDVTVNAVAPGLVETRLTTSLDEARYAEIVHSIPAGRSGTPDEVAAAIAFLCSDAAAYTNGAVLVTDGAMTA